MSTPFSPASWVERYRSAQRFRGGPGTSRGHAMLHAELLGLHEELFEQLKLIEHVPGDLFDRPQLTLVVYAVTQATHPEGGAA